jgi:hypothetical protein
MSRPKERFAWKIMLGRKEGRRKVEVGRLGRAVRLRQGKNCGEVEEDG